MIRLDRHPECTLLSFHEERALPWISDNKGLSSNVNAAVMCRRRIDGGLLWACLHRASEVHDALRTRFVVDASGIFRRYVLEPGADCLSFSEFDTTHHVEDEELAAQVADFCNTPVSIEDRHWLRALLIHAAADTSVIVISAPHIISDAVSIHLLITRIWRDYACRAEGKLAELAPPMPSLRDFAGAQRAWGATRDFEDKLATLATKVATGIERIRAADPARHAAAPLPARPSASLKHVLTAELAIALKAAADHAHVSLPNVLTSCTALAIAQLFQRREFCFRLPFSNRILPGTADIVGFLSNDVPIFVSIDPDERIDAFIKALTKHAFIMATRFGSVPWSVLTERLKASGTVPAGRNPFDDYLINVFPAMGDLEPLPGYRARNFPLALAAFTSNELKVWWHIVNGNVIATLKIGMDETERAQREYVPALLRVLEHVARCPDGRIGDCLQ